MHLFVLLVVAVVLAWDSGVRPFGDDGAAGRPWIGAIVAIALPSVAWALASALCRAAADGRVAAVTVRRTDRLLRVAPWTILAVHVVAVFGFGFVAAVRQALGDRILLDELVAVLPPLLAVVAVWWATWPVERRCQEAAILARLDAGDPDDPWSISLPGRAATVWHQVRAQILLILVPIMVALSLAEAFRAAVARFLPEWIDAVDPWAPLVAVGTALVAAPLAVRVALGLRPLPAGELRDELMAVCTKHRVRIREILVWSTGGLMLNGAVLGLVGRLRYVLLTDALIDRLPRPLLLGVMAHEIGHIRRRHLPWLAVGAVSSLWIAATAAWFARDAFDAALVASLGADAVGWMFIGTAIEASVVLVGAVGGIGWVSRRLEWQADAFAAVHLCGDEAKIVDESAVDTMCAALETVTVAAGGDPRARSWRHGSIRERQRRLRSLIGRSVSRLPIDRRVTLLKLALLAIVVLAAVTTFLP